MCKKSGKNIRYFSVQILEAVWDRGRTRIKRYEKRLIRVGAKSRQEAVESIPDVCTVLRVFRLS